MGETGGTQDDLTGASGPNRRALLKGAVAAGVGAAAWTAPDIKTLGFTPAYAQVLSGCETSTAEANYVPNTGQRFSCVANSCPPGSSDGATLIIPEPGGGLVTIEQTSYDNGSGTATFDLVNAADTCVLTVEWWDDPNTFNSAVAPDVTSNTGDTNVTLSPINNGSGRIRVTVACGPDCV